MIGLGRITRKVDRLLHLIRRWEHDHEAQMLLLGRLFAEQVRARGRVASLAEVEFRVFSQFGDDGIVQYLKFRLDFPHRTFIEFGVEDYQESTTRFLLMNDNWSGYVIDSAPDNVSRIRRAPYFWAHDLEVDTAWVGRENVNELLARRGFHPDVGILHIDVDGNDYWIWEAIDVITPIIVIMEYNSVFGAERSITVPYDLQFERLRKHHSQLYFGASLPALTHLARRKGYSLIGSNSAGNNAYFVRSDRMDGLEELEPAEAYVESKFRESRDADGRPTYLSGAGRRSAIAGLPVVNVVSGETEKL